MALTRRQREILDFIAEFIRTRRYSPSLEEIAGHFGLSSVATVHKHVSNLEKKGFIRRAWNRSRSIDLVAGPSLVRGSVGWGRSCSPAGGFDGGGRVPWSGGRRSPRQRASSKPASTRTPSEGRTWASRACRSLGRVAAGLPIEAVVEDRDVDRRAGTEMVGRGRCVRSRR